MTERATGQTAKCPECGAGLALEGLPQRAMLVCSQCRTLFPAAGRPTERISRAAIASLLLGAASLVCALLTGIPAVFLGWRALRDMRAAGSTLRGRGAARMGILLGLFGSVACTGCIGFVGGNFWLVLYTQQRVMQFAQQAQVVEDRPSLAAIERELGPLTVPAGLTPVRGVPFSEASPLLGALVWENAPSSSVQLLIIETRGFNTGAAASSVAPVLSERLKVRTLTSVTRQEFAAQSPSTFGLTRHGAQADGTRVVEYTRQIERPDGAFLVLLVAPEQPAGGAQASGIEDLRQQFVRLVDSLRD